MKILEEKPVVHFDSSLHYLANLFNVERNRIKISAALGLKRFFQGLVVKTIALLSLKNSHQFDVTVTHFYELSLTHCRSPCRVMFNAKRTSCTLIPNRIAPLCYAVVVVEGVCAAGSVTASNRMPDEIEFTLS